MYLGIRVDPWELLYFPLIALIFTDISSIRVDP